MFLKKLLLISIVMIFMTGILSTEAATTESSVALQPWTTEIVDQITGGYVGSHVSIDHYERNGRVYVSYYDATNGNLKLAYQVDSGTGNCPGNSSWMCTTVDSSGNDVGMYSSIDVIDASINLTTGNEGEINAAQPQYPYAKVGISYYDNTAKALKFAMRSCVSSGGFPSCSWTITTVDDDTSIFLPANRGQYSSFQFGTNATPIIYYHSFSIAVGGVKRAYVTGAVSGYCDAGWTCEVVAQSTASANFGTHISTDGGSVVFYDSTNSELVMARSTGSIMSTSCGLVNYWDCDVIDSNADVGKFASLYYDGVHPMQVAYYNATNGKVKYAIGVTSGTGNCTNNNFNCFAVDTIGTTTLAVNIGLSLTLDAQGQPIIAYQDFSEDMAPAALKIARPSSVYNMPVGNCGDVPPGYLFNYWQCKLLDGGGSYLNEANYAAVSVSPAGLATVAYYETDDYYYEGRLKVAQQHFMEYLPLIRK